ncbi:hypothetical protein [Streptomyces sp. NPDC059564]
MRSSAAGIGCWSFVGLPHAVTDASNTNPAGISPLTGAASTRPDSQA